MPKQEAKSGSNCNRAAGSPVTMDYPPSRGSEFTGQMNWVEFDTGNAADDHNHLISAEERLQVAMAKQ